MSEAPAESVTNVTNLVTAKDFAPEPESPFLLTREEWTHVQTYVAMTTRLPRTPKDLEDELGFVDEDFLEGDTEALRASFEDIADVFSEMHDHCFVWENETYPDVVDIAHRISQYATKFPSRATWLRRCIQDLGKALKKGDKDAVRDRFESVRKWVDLLVGEVRKNQRHARETADEIGVFATQTEHDNDELKRISNEAQAAWNMSEEAQKELKIRIAAIQEQLTQINKKYIEAIIIAATTPTYIIVGGIVGFIAMPIVSGIFGARAAELKKLIDGLMKDIKELREELGKKEKLAALLHTGQESLKPIQKQARDAQTVVEKAWGIWESIAKDLNAIPGTLQSIIEEQQDPDAFLMEMDLDTAVDQWAHAGTAADAFRIYAYVKFEEEQAAA